MNKYGAEQVFQELDRHIQRFAMYSDQVRKDGSEIHWDFSLEITQKLRQSRLILNDLLIVLEKQSQLSYMSDSAEVALLQQELEDRLFLYSGTFYQLLHRAGKLIEQLPGFGSLKFRLILIARNNFVEHPDGQAQIYSNSLAYSADSGVLLKVDRFEHESTRVKDIGMWENFREFSESLEQLLTANLR